MRKWFFFIVGAAFFIAAGAVVPRTANAYGEYDPSALPHTKAAIMALNEKQISILHRAQRYCIISRNEHRSRNFCVAMNTDTDIRLSGDKALIAFHWALRPSERYDDRRSWATLKRLLKQ